MTTSRAQGYVLEGPHVLELMVKALAGVKSLRVDQQVIIEDRAVSDHPLILAEVLTFQFPGRFRSDAWYRDSHRILVVSGGQALIVIDGRLTADVESRFDRYKDLLLYRSRQLLLKALVVDGVDVGRVSLGRLDDRIAIVIGAQYPDESVSQVWVDQERFLPLRWINYGAGHESAASHNDHLEFVYRNWQKWGDVWWPAHIESYHNHQLVRQMRIRGVQADVPVPERLMSIVYQKSIYAPVEPRSEQPPETDVNTVRETGDDIKKGFEN